MISLLCRSRAVSSSSTTGGPLLSSSKHGCTDQEHEALPPSRWQEILWVPPLCTLGLTRRSMKLSSSRACPGMAIILTPKKTEREPGLSKICGPHREFLLISSLRSKLDRAAFNL